MDFRPELLAKAGLSYLYMGGMVDEEGNVFREKDVLADDYSSPYIIASHEYKVSVKKIYDGDITRMKLTDENGRESFLVLSEDEMDALKAAGFECEKPVAA